jgi:hypothetical protein
LPPFRNEAIFKQLVEGWSRQFGDVGDSSEKDLLNFLLQKKLAVEDLFGKTK